MKTLWLTEGGTQGHWLKNKPHEGTKKWYREYVPKDAFDEIIKILKLINEDNLSRVEMRQLADKVLKTMDEI